MKTKSTIYVILTGLILLIACITNTSGQNPEFTFTAQYNGQHILTDSILIINLTQGGDTMLYAPDTVLAIVYAGINEHNQNKASSLSVSQNYPNPFVDQTFIDVWIEKKDHIEIHVLDISGRKYAYYESVLDVGKHTFEFYPGNENIYIFSATNSKLTRSIKLLNPLSINQDCKLTYNGFEKQEGTLKSHRDDGFLFYWGDNLRIITYTTVTAQLIRAGDFIDNIPENSRTYQFNVTKGIPCVDIPRLYYQGQWYKTVKIGSQCWLKQNLNIGTMIPGLFSQTDNDTIEKYCHSDDPVNCELYGGLYQWDEMMIYTTGEGAQGICPEDWHIPTDEEWKQLEGEVDSQYGYPDPEWDTVDYRGYNVGYRLKSDTGWLNNNNGNDYFGFCALPAGSRFVDGLFYGYEKYTGLWSSTEGENPDNTWYRYMEDIPYFKVARYPRIQTMGRSVRCVLDE